MTAIATAMLGIVLLATAVLGAVGLAHELTQSARGRRWIRRRRAAASVRVGAVVDVLRLVTGRGLRTCRRVIAEYLGDSASSNAPLGNVTR